MNPELHPLEHSTIMSLDTSRNLDFEALLEKLVQWIPLEEITSEDAGEVDRHMH